MKKREFFFLILIILFSVLFVFKNRAVFVNSTFKKGDAVIEKDVPYFISVLQRGDVQVLSKVYQDLNKLDYPVALFNLTMDPVVWNDSALNYTGDYLIVKTVDILGNPIGYVGVGEGKKDKKSPDFLNLWIFLLILFFIISFSNIKAVNIISLFFFILAFLFSGEFLPVVLFFSLLYIKFGKKYIDERLASFIFFLFALVGFYSFFNTPFVFHDLIKFFKNSDFFQHFFVLIISSTFFLMFKPSKFVFVLLVAALFFGFPLFVFALILFLISLYTSKKISAFLLKLLIFSVSLTVFGHYYSFYKVNAFVKSADFSYNFLEKTGRRKVENYLKLAKSKGFSDLKDFVERSNLKDEDYFVAYINVLGEIVEAYSNNLPEKMEAGEGFSFSREKVGNLPRFIVSGSGRFKVGKIVISIANDVYSHPVLKRHPEIINYLTVKEGKKGFVVKVKGMDYFNLVSDLSIVFIGGIIFFLVFSSSQKKRGLFERVIFSIYVGFSIIFIVLGLILFVFSNKIATKVIEKNVADNLRKIEGLIEREPDRLSTEYLQWLKEVFKVNIGVYGNGVLHLSTDRSGLTLLMPFPAFNKIKAGHGEIYFFRGLAYKSIDIKDIPYAVLSVKGDRDLNPMYEFLRIVSFVFFVIFVVSYFVSFEITRELVSPLVKLSDRAKAVVKGDFEVSVNYDRDDEIKELIESISFMARSLKENYDRLKTIIDNVSSAIVLLDSEGKVVLSNRAFDLIEDEIKERVLKGSETDEFNFRERRFVVYRKEVETNLKMIVVEDLTDVVKASKLEVITDIARKVAHDIKNPLTPIKLNIDYLLSVLKRKEMNVEEVLPKIADNILQKVDELKNISSQFSGIFKASKDITFEKINIKEFLENLFSSYPGVDFKIKGEEASVKASRLKLARIFENLIENTLSFSESPLIEIDIREKGDYVEVAYRDNGIGIDEINVDKVFDPYFSTREDGTGLGLFIVKEFIREMGGEIKAFPSKKGGHFELKFRKIDS